MKRNSLYLVLLAGLGCLLLHPADAQVVEVTDPLKLFETTNDKAASQVLPVGHFSHGGHDAACCDTGCDGGCDALCATPSCDAIGSCGCRPGKPKCECCKCRETLFGDLMGARSCLAEHGIEYRASLTQFYQGVSSGGAQETFRYGGKLDQWFDLSTEKMGLWKGGLLEIHSPTLYGENSILDAAALAPANTAFLIPRPFDLPVISITNFSYTQELGEGFAVTAGKYDFLDLWAKFLPDYGRGLDGFMNTNSLIFMNVVPTLPTVFNGAGLLKAGKKGLEAGVFVIDPTTTATVSGISDLFDDGTSMLGFYRIYTNFGGLPGSHLGAGVYSNRVYTNYDRNGWSFHPEQGIEAGQKSGSWLGAYVGEQTLWQDRCDKNRKIWFLTTMGWADSKTSPYQFSGSYSIEAKGWNINRPGDRMGLAYFYSDVSDDLENLVPAIVGLEDVQGGEFYYNAEINPWFHVTGDVQLIDTEIASQDTAVVLGVRAKIDL